MSELKLSTVRIKEGVWYGELIAELGEADAPQIEVRHLDQVLENLKVTADPNEAGRFALQVSIPAALLSDGVQTFVVLDAQTEAKLESFAIVTGQPVEGDLRAEINLLREELDMLKRAFRRHCVETM